MTGQNHHLGHRMHCDLWVRHAAFFTLPQLTLHVLMVTAGLCWRRAATEGALREEKWLGRLEPHLREKGGQVGSQVRCELDLGRSNSRMNPHDRLEPGAMVQPGPALLVPM